jgi:hypothetical protein
MLTAQLESLKLRNLSVDVMELPKVFGEITAEGNTSNYQI